MKKLKPIIPSQREKKRYLAFEIISDSKGADFRQVSLAINSAVFGFLGQLEAGKAGIMMLREKYNPELQRGLIKVNYRYLDKLRASLCLVDKVGDEKAIARSLGASGIIKKADAKYLH